MNDEELMIRVNALKASILELESELDSTLKSGETGNHIRGAAMELGEVAKWLRSDRESEEVPISGDVRNSRPTDSGF